MAPLSERVYPIQKAPLSDRVYPIQKAPLSDRVYPIQKAPLSDRVYPIKSHPYPNVSIPWKRLSKRVSPLQKAPLSERVYPIQKAPLSTVSTPCKRHRYPTVSTPHKRHRYPTVSAPLKRHAYPPCLPHTKGTAARRLFWWGSGRIIFQTLWNENKSTTKVLKGNPSKPMAFKPIRFKVAGYEPVGTISTIAHLLKPSPALNSFKTMFYTSAFWIKWKLVWGI